MAGQRYTSDAIVRPRATDSGYFRVDLILDDVDHGGASYEGRVFLDNAKADASSPRTPEAGYAGSFYVFGHGGCFGELGHCDVPAGPRDPYDLRPPHQLVPHTKILPVTDAVTRSDADEVAVTIVPVVRDSPATSADDNPLRFSSLRLVAYE